MANRWGTGRTEAFSDGVFAIAITLLVLDISVPEADLDDLWNGIVDQWPAYLGYTTSFLTSRARRGRVRRHRAAGQLDAAGRHLADGRGASLAAAT